MDLKKVKVKQNSSGYHHVLVDGQSLHFDNHVYLLITTSINPEKGDSSHNEQDRMRDFFILKMPVHCTIRPGHINIINYLKTTVKL